MSEERKVERIRCLCFFIINYLDRIMRADEHDTVYLTLDSVQYIFTVCIRLRLPPDIRYLAVLIFARFMRIHTEQVLDFLDTMKMNEKRRYHKQLSACYLPYRLRPKPLAITTFQSLSSKQVCSCLRSLGFAYTQRAALKADIERVKADWMLLGGGTVAAAVQCVLNVGRTEQIVAHIAKLSGTPREDIFQMAAAITETTLLLQKGLPK
ncbi:hypothetical protein OESDEN_09081 [Oesophagostomum dentatum]|uniref:Cyclin N-terminal domain-containing protein n=1 Tax=Oesophagostomum dentatum TaxID=61180 RepID=A0A0B1T1E0_OESDE|nr:hypothetical protein OESDEN_09081 [Oesophagostomum dentatum]